MDTAPLPVCDWVYFATPARGSWTVTSEFVTEAKMIIRNAHNSKGERIANVQNLQPGEKILLAYGGGGKPYRPLYSCTVTSAANPVRSARHDFAVFAYVDESLSDRLRDSHYSPDPVQKKCMGIAVTGIRDLRQLTETIRRPAGNNTLRRWDEVFPE